MLISMEDILCEISKYFNFQIADILSHKRTKMCVMSRHLAIILCRDLTLHSYTEIGNLFNRDHSTIIYVCQNKLKLMNDETFTIFYRNLSDILMSKFDTV